MTVLSIRWPPFLNEYVSSDTVNHRHSCENGFWRKSRHRWMLLRLRSHLSFPANWTSLSGHLSPPTWTRPEVYLCSAPPRAESRESIADADVFPRFTMQERMLRAGAGKLSDCSRGVLWRAFRLILSHFSPPEPGVWVWREGRLLKVAVLSRSHTIIGQRALGKKAKPWQRWRAEIRLRQWESGGLSLRLQNSAAALTDVNQTCRCFNWQVCFMSLIWYHDTQFCLQLWN